MTSPCARAVTHHTGCACHEARRDAEVAELRAEVERLGEDVDRARVAFAHEWGTFEPLREALGCGDEQTNEDAVALAVERIGVLRAEVERLTGRVESLVELVSGSAPLTWTATSDTDTAAAWERRALALVQSEAAAGDAPLVRLRPGQVAVSEWAEPAPGVTLAHAWIPSGPLPTLQAGPTSWSVGWRGGTADSLPAAQAAAEAAVAAVAVAPLAVAD